MKHPDREKDQHELQQLISERFRRERQRLRISTTDVAHYCGMSVSSVFSWEAGRSRIPLSAVACLWEHGFDVERLVEGTGIQQAVPLLSEGEEYKKAQAEYFVPMHMIQRHQYTPSSVFAYHNRAYAENISAPGDLILMGMLENQDVGDINKETIVLFRPNRSGLHEFFCMIRTAGRGRLHVKVSDIVSTVATKTMLTQGNIIAEFCYRIGYRHSETAAPETHSQRLSAFTKHIGANSR